ncbi:uncharacterized protein LOC129241329 [Anastrepha obliqua]|uniref:uncharacterized protein LOC129241329 n=1 Tax=Anastrepha obliqua TaxID=95512 RepID=UPI0024090174|nr:uncharacterized protein LOC129241329 [Anastrepha obliqua]
MTTTFYLVKEKPYIQWNNGKEKSKSISKNAGDWKAKATALEDKWNLNPCIGAIDGKHDHIKKEGEADGRVSDADE